MRAQRRDDERPMGAGMRRGRAEKDGAKSVSGVAGAWKWKLWLETEWQENIRQTSVGVTGYHSQNTALLGVSLQESSD